MIARLLNWFSATVAFTVAAVAAWWLAEPAPVTHLAASLEEIRSYRPGETVRIVREYVVTKPLAGLANRSIICGPHVYLLAESGLGGNTAPGHYVATFNIPLPEHIAAGRTRCACRS